MYKVVLGLIFSTLVFPAFAQSPNQPQLTPGQKAVALSYQQIGLTIDQLIKEYEERLTQEKQRYKNLDDYLKACGDKPGCTVPLKEGTKP